MKFLLKRWPLYDSQRRWRSHSLFTSGNNATSSLPGNLQMWMSSSYSREEETAIQIPEIRSISKNIRLHGWIQSVKMDSLCVINCVTKMMKESSHLTAVTHRQN